MAQQKPPVIFLAFANDLVDQKAFLRGLKKEREGIREALKVAEKAGLCELIIEPNTSIQNIIDTFQEYGDRIAIFHYAGHSNSFQLLLETLDGTHASAHSEGLISFLAKQHALKLIFLNGCSSGEQALGLVESGIEAVIGTSNSINDDIANLLAIRFYKGLAQGKTLENAWDEAVDEVKIKKGTANVRDLFWDGQEAVAPTNSSEGTNANPFPWSIHYRDKAKLAGWNLPKAANNHLFGLPPIAETPLPVQPFPNVAPYTAEYAEVFFGRTRYIRQLYELITSPNTPPIILLSGQSGVGKTSLIEAGLLPRLESSHCTKIISEVGQSSFSIEIENALEEMLSPFIDEETEKVPSLASVNDKTDFIQQLIQLSEENPEFQDSLTQLIEQAKAEQKQQSGVTDVESFEGAWHYTESRLRRPILMILDHLEELNLWLKKDSDEELEQITGLLHQLFVLGEYAIKGKFIFSVREDYSKSVEQSFRKANLPFTKFHIDRLNQEEIIEVVEGLTSTERLKNRYQFEVAPKLPTLIADDLLADDDSSISLVLQIILAKMWQDIQGNNTLTFSPESYKAVAGNGLHLADYYNDQLNKLVTLDESLHWAVEYGFILDILYRYTANQRLAIAQKLDDITHFFFGEISEENPQDKSLVEGIINILEYLVEVGLLVTLDNETKRLAHNGLAVVICNRYRSSTQLVQRANRMINYKVMEHQLNSSILFDQAELDMFIELEDKTDFRVLNEDENALINKSIEFLNSEEDDLIDLEWSIYDTIGDMRYLQEQRFLDYLQQQLSMYPAYGATFFTYITQDILGNYHEEKLLELAFAFAKAYPVMPIQEGEDLESYHTILDTRGKMNELADGEPFRRGVLHNGMEGEEAVSYYLEVNSSTQFAIVHASNSETTTIDTDEICSIDVIEDQFPLICTNDGMVSLWNFKGQKLIELGQPNPDYEQHYLAAAYDAEVGDLVLQSSDGIEVYSLTLEVILEENQESMALPAHLEMHIQERLEVIKELMEIQKEHEEDYKEEVEEQDSHDE